MAVATELLKATRTALLFRMQQAREARARSDAAVAAHAHEAACNNSLEAARKVDLHVAESADRLGRAWGAARSGRTELSDLMNLRATEQELRKQAAHLKELARVAQRKSIAAEQEMQSASSRAVHESRVTARRNKLAQRYAELEFTRANQMEEVWQEEEATLVTACS